MYNLIVLIKAILLFDLIYGDIWKLSLVCVRLCTVVIVTSEVELLAPSGGFRGTSVESTRWRCPVLTMSMDILLVDYSVSQSFLFLYIGF